MHDEEALRYRVAANQDQMQKYDALTTQCSVNEWSERR